MKNKSFRDYINLLEDISNGKVLYGVFSEENHVGYHFRILFETEQEAQSYADNNGLVVMPITVGKEYYI